MYTSVPLGKGTTSYRPPAHQHIFPHPSLVMSRNISTQLNTSDAPIWTCYWCSPRTSNTITCSDGHVGVWSLPPVIPPPSPLLPPTYGTHPSLPISIIPTPKPFLLLPFYCQ